MIRIDKIDKILEQFSSLTEEFGIKPSKNVSKYTADKELKQNIKNDDVRRKNQFQTRIQNLRETGYLQDYVGRYSDNTPVTQDERRSVLRQVVSELAKDTKNGSIPKGKSFSVSKDWRKKVNSMIDKIIEYEEMTGKNFNPYGESESDSLQGLLNFCSKSADGKSINKEGSILQNQKVIKFINYLECILYNSNKDYCSTVRTPKQQEDLGMQVEIKAPKDVKRIIYQNEDYEKLESRIEAEIKGNFKNAEDIHVAVTIGRAFGCRLDTIVELTVADIIAKDGCIKVPDEKNKSNVDYRAVTLNPNSQNILGQIVERALLKADTDNLGEIKIVSADKKSLYRSFGRLEKRAGIEEGKYKGARFHALRRAFANEYFDVLMDEGNLFEDVKKEVDRALGHDPKEKQRHLEEYLTPDRLYGV